MHWFPNWVTFRHPHRLFWMDYPTVQLFLLIYVGYTLFLAITSILLVLKRNHYMFRNNPIGAAVLAAFMQWLISSIHMYRFVSSASLPIWLMIMRNYVMFPLCLVFGIQARGMHILFDVIWTWSIGHPALSRSIPELGESKLSGWQWVQVRIKSPRLHVWLKNRGTFIMLSILSGLHLMAATILLILNWTKQLPYHTREAFGLEDFGVAVSVVLYMLIWSPLMLYYLRGVKDAYGLRRDLKVGVSYALPCYILYACFRGYGFLQSIRAELPSFIFMLSSMSCLHGASVVYPLIRTFFWTPEGFGLCDTEEQRVERQSPYDVIARKANGHIPAIIVPHRPIPLEQVLDHPYLAGPFEIYSKNAFVWDSVLFYRAINAFRRRVSQDPKCIELEAQRIYEQYIETGSPCEMNLSYPVVQRINMVVDRGIIDADLFDEAQTEILRLVGNCTYRNFLYTLEQTVKARYVIPFARPIIQDPSLLDIQTAIQSTSPSIGGGMVPRCYVDDFAAY